jgi:hypothetical protein
MNRLCFLGLVVVSALAYFGFPGCGRRSWWWRWEHWYATGNLWDDAHGFNWERHALDSIDRHGDVQLTRRVSGSGDRDRVKAAMGNS